jgi:hypothetical protein
VRDHTRTLQPSENREEEEEEEEVNLSRFLRTNQYVFKLVVGGSNALGLAPNLVILLLALGTSIRLHCLGFGSVEVQI